MFTKEKRFKIGDVVQLKSGGPEMTVNTLMGEQVICAWFVGNDEKNAAFHQDALNPASG